MPKKDKLVRRQSLKEMARKNIINKAVQAGNECGAFEFIIHECAPEENGVFTRVYDFSLGYEFIGVAVASAFPDGIIQVKVTVFDLRELAGHGEVIHAGPVIPVARTSFHYNDQEDQIEMREFVRNEFQFRKGILSAIASRGM
ncbi:MAG: hypothetical protein ACAH27_17020 [Xanthobacteraceae bacterium]